MFLEYFDETPGQTFPGLPGGADLARQVSFHSRDRQPNSKIASRQPAALSQWFAEEMQTPSGCKPKSFGPKSQSGAAIACCDRRYHLCPRWQAYRRLGHSPLGRWLGQGAMRRNLCFEDRGSMVELGRYGLPSQILLPQGRIQKQNSIGARDSSRPSSEDSRLCDCADGQLVYLRSHPDSYYRSWLDFRGSDQMQSDSGNKRQENRRPSPGH